MYIIKNLIDITSLQFKNCLDDNQRDTLIEEDSIKKNEHMNESMSSDAPVGKSLVEDPKDLTEGEILDIEMEDAEAVIIEIDQDLLEDKIDEKLSSIPIVFSQDNHEFSASSSRDKNTWNDVPASTASSSLIIGATISSETSQYSNSSAPNRVSMRKV